MLSENNPTYIQTGLIHALWNSGKTALELIKFQSVFTEDGELVEKLAVPVVRPTNCMYNVKKGQLWVTSASEELSKIQFMKHHDSKSTLVFDLGFQ